MSDDELQPTTVAPSTRVTVAFPFSSIKIQEPDDRLRELAAIVVELAAQLEAIAPSPEAQELRDRARSCAATLTS